MTGMCQMQLGGYYRGSLICQQLTVISLKIIEILEASKHQKILKKELTDSQPGMTSAFPSFLKCQRVCLGACTHV